MKRTSDTSFSHTELATSSSAENARLPVKPDENKSLDLDEDGVTPRTFSKPQTPDPFDAQSDALPIQDSPDIAHHLSSTNPILVNAEQRNTDQADTAVRPHTPADTHQHVASASSGTSYATAIDVVTLLREAAWSGDANAQFELACHFNAEGAEQDISQATNWLTIAANQNHPAALHELAIMYENGQGVEKNLQNAAKLNCRLAERGDSDAQFVLGKIYKYGKGVEQDYQLAAEWLGKAAQQGHLDAQRELAHFFQHGPDVTKNFKLAAEWLGKAAEQGDCEDQISLGYLFQQGGYGLKQDIEKAVFWFEKAAKQNEPDSQIELLVMYKSGHGVKKNLELAAYWDLRWGLEEDGKTTACGTSEPAEIIERIPDVLKKYREFEDVRELTLSSIDINEAEVAATDQLIRADTFIEILRLKPMSDVSASSAKWPEKLMESLRSNNTHLTSLDFGVEIDAAVKLQVAQLLDQNKSIAELRRYLAKHPAVNSDDLTLGVLALVADELIVNSIRNGSTKVATELALDEFLLSAQYRVIEGNTKQSS